MAMSTKGTIVLWDGLTPTKKKLATYAALAGGGYLSRSRVLTGIGIAGLIGAAIELWQEHEAEAHPELMNGFFQTGGKLSAVRGEDQARALRGLRGLRGLR